MLLDGTDKHVSSTAVLGDAQRLLTPARRSWESVFSVTVWLETQSVGVAGRCQ